MAQNPFSDLFSMDPFAELHGFREAFRQMVEAGWPLPRDFMPAGMAAVIVPVDILDTGPELLIQSNLPGVKPADLNVSVTGATLTIKGELQDMPETEGATYLRRERRATSFFRQVPLPVEVDADAASAKLENGVLTLTLPKAEKVRPRNIRIAKEE